VPETRRRAVTEVEVALALVRDPTALYGRAGDVRVDTRQKHLVLILAREFASNLSTPTLVADARGCLVFYNEAAEGVIGRRFAEVGETLLDDWLGVFEARSLASEPIPPERRPARIALDERRPAHLRYLVTSADGVEREIEVTAFPLFAHTEEFVGIVVIFWRV
jgi:PAS domain-containing protein